MELRLNKFEELRVHEIANPRIKEFLVNMLALEDPRHGTQINVGLRRMGIDKQDRIIRPKFVKFEEARTMLKGDKDNVVALGNGGYSQVAEPNEWFAGSVVGKVNGAMPFVFNSQNVEPGKQLIYAAPALVIGRGDGKIEILEVEVHGPANFRDIKRALREATGTPRNYGLLKLENDILRDVSASYTATYSYSYETSYISGKCDGKPRAIEVNGEPLTVIISANSVDTHGIRENGENVHVESIKLAEGAMAKGVVFALS